MASLVVVKESGIVVIDGQDETVRAGDLFEADDPVVAKYPDLFGPVELRFPAKRKSEAKVEAATAAPGEKRQR